MLLPTHDVDTFSILAMLEEAQNDVTALSMCISLIVNELKGLSIYLLAIWSSF